MCISGLFFFVTYIEKERERHKELVHTIMETEKSHDLQSARRRPKPRKASSVIQSEYKAIRTRGANDVDSSPGLKA